MNLDRGTEEWRNQRFSIEPDKVFEVRSHAQRDRDRLLYSSAFRRLAGVTQVVSADEDRHLLHNRLTHSIKVAQIARRLAERLQQDEKQREIACHIGGIDPDVVETAALAHDLGHPPFGHAGEKALDELAQRHSGCGFEGNAQSFRIVSRIAIRTTRYDGLNLTRATLNALLKYPWLRGTDGAMSTSQVPMYRKWSVYETEIAQFRFAREGPDAKTDRKCVEAEIMDWADDIAYSVHDVEDFYRAGLIPLDKLAAPNSDERRRFFYNVRRRHAEKGILTGYQAEELEEAATKALLLVPESGYETSTRSRADLRTFTSNFIATYVAAFSLRVPSHSGESYVRIEDQAKKEVTMLKELTWQYVIHSPALATQQVGYRKVIETLFNRLFSAAASKRGHNLAMFPLAFRNDLEQCIAESRNARGSLSNDGLRRIGRIVLDVISTMTERQALRMYGRLTGTDPGSILDPLYY
jgi:dGTPase